VPAFAGACACAGAGAGAGADASAHLPSIGSSSARDS